MLKLPTKTAVPSGAVASAAVNLNPKAKDCYYYFYSHCSKGNTCTFRHCSAALGSEQVCQLWVSGGCTRDVCAFRHMVLNRKRSATPCYWENQPSGCLKQHCPFQHSKPHVEVAGALTRLNEFKETAQFANVKVKTLEEIHHEKNPTPPCTQPSRTTITPTSFNLQSILTTPTSSPSQNPPASTHQQQFSLSKIHMQPKTFASMMRAGFAGNTSIFNPNYQSPFKSSRGSPSVPGRKMQGYFENRVWKPDPSNQSTPSHQKTGATAMPTYTTAVSGSLDFTSQNSTPSQPPPCVIQVSPLPTDNGIPHQFPHISPVSNKSPPPQDLAVRTVNGGLNGTAAVSNKSTPTLHTTAVRSAPLRTVRVVAGDGAPIQPSTALQNTKDTVTVRASPGVQSLKEKRAQRFGLVSDKDLDFQVKTLDEIRAEKKRKRVQEDNVENDDIPPLRDVVPTDTPPHPGEAVDKPGEQPNPPAAKKKKVVIIRRKSSASCERQSSDSSSPTVDSLTSESGNSVRRIMIRRVKTSKPPSTHPPPTTDWTCVDRSKPIEDMEGIGQENNTHSQPVSGDPTEPVVSSSTGGEEVEGSTRVQPLGEQQEAGEEVRRKSVAEVKAEIQRELDRSRAEVKGDETVDDELQQLAELEDGEADNLLASRTDDDLILEMEEFM